MSKPKSGKREFDAEIERFLNPPRMTLDQILASADPVREASVRLVHMAVEGMSSAEHWKWNTEPRCCASWSSARTNSSRCRASEIALMKRNHR